MTLSDLHTILGRAPGTPFPIFVRELDGKEWEIEALETSHRATDKGTTVKHVIVLKEKSNG